MPQARLPDINTAFITYRREAISSLKSRNYDSCFGSLYALNGLLPDKYRVQISTIQYMNKTKQDIIAVCTGCEGAIDFNTVKLYRLLVPLVDSLVSGSEYEKVWDCPKCNKTNSMSETKLVQKILAEPSFLHIVPKPPERKDGLLDRNSYHKKVSSWVWTFIYEIEERMAQFRDDNWTKGDEMDDYTDIDTEGEGDD